MNLLSVRDLRSKPAEVWKRLSSSREMVVTSNGRPVAVLSAVTEETLEETLAAIRRARALTAVAEMQRQSTERGVDAMSLDEINSEIAAVRRSRRRQRSG